MFFVSSMIAWYIILDGLMQAAAFPLRLPMLPMASITSKKNA